MLYYTHMKMLQVILLNHLRQIVNLEEKTVGAKTLTKE